MLNSSMKGFILNLGTSRGDKRATRFRFRVGNPVAPSRLREVLNWNIVQRYLTAKLDRNPEPQY